MPQAVDRALALATPQICNRDQGSHFTSPQYIERLLAKTDSPVVGLQDTCIGLLRFGERIANGHRHWKPLMLDYTALLPPWERPSASLEAQLYREVKPGHALFGLEVHALARRRDNDDVLFAVSGAALPFAVVHLTWADTSQCQSQFPETEFYASVEDWVGNRMKPDNSEYEAS